MMCGNMRTAYKIMAAYVRKILENNTCSIDILKPNEKVETDLTDANTPAPM